MRCRVCNEIIPFGSEEYRTMAYLGGGYRAHRDCCEYCPVCDHVMVPGEDCEYCLEQEAEYIEDYDEDGILDYGANAAAILGFQGNPKDKMFFGVELEVEVGSGYATEVAREVRNLMPGFVITKHDGSIAYGFEIVSAPAELKLHYENWPKLFNEGLPLKSFDTDTCGMHIHISRNILSPSQLGRIYSFVHAPKNTRFIEKIAGRSLRKGNGAHYAPLRKVSGKDGKIVNDFKLTNSVMVAKTTSGKKLGLRWIPKAHRGAINDLKRSTIEFRMFRGTLHEGGFFKNLEFIRALTQFCKPGVTSIPSLLDPNAFVQYVTENRKDYRYLMKFIDEKQPHIPRKKEEISEKSIRPVNNSYVLLPF
jgi:Putative amidoligase enzyme